MQYVAQLLFRNLSYSYMICMYLHLIRYIPLVCTCLGISVRIAKCTDVYWARGGGVVVYPFLS